MRRILRAEHGVLFDGVVFGRRQRARLAQHIVGHANLADVVEQRAEADDFEIVGRQVQRRGRWRPTAR